MSIILAFTLLASPQYVRVPQKQALPELGSGPVWVFFTDKGVYDDATCRAGTDALSRTADPAVRDRRLQNPVNGFDFDDLPVRDEYVSRIEQLGARVRVKSSWLNAASFEMGAAVAGQVYRLPFVYDVRPVGYRVEPDWDLVVPIARPPRRSSRGLDTADAHRFYGASYDQAQMMGVPEVADKGFHGSGVKLAIFDTGLKLRNQAVQGLVPWKQHDFISGDHFYAATDATWTPTQVPNLRYLGLVKDPVLCPAPADTAAGQPERLILAFCADSFNYAYGTPQRGVFYSHSEDRGLTWSAPELAYLSRPSYQTFENLSMAGRGSVTYLAYDQLTETAAGSTGEVYVGWFIGAEWSGQRAKGTGRWPHIGVVEDSLYIAYVVGDSTLLFNRAGITLPEPGWGTPVQIQPGEAITDPQVCPGLAGHINLFCCGRVSGRIYWYQSVDGGLTFVRQPDIAAADAAMPRLFGDGRDKLLLFKDYGLTPFTRLTAMRTATWGDEWYAPVGVTESTLSVGSYSASIWGPDTASQATVVYESQGLVRRATTPLWGGTWSEPHSVIDTAGFCYGPCLASLDEATALVSTWFKRGDDNTVWEGTDTLRFSQDQSDHGTRMASLIAGWQPYSIVGIAPAVDLLVAKTEFHKTRHASRYEYNMEEDTYVEALEWAEAEGAEIVSTSLGYRGWYRADQMDGRTAPVSIAASQAAKRGLLIVTAMGNRDSTYNPWPQPYITAPADADGVIAAGGIERNGLPWRGTGTGPTADGRVKPDFVALADTVAAASPDSINALDGATGTSCATALIAGACALVKEAHPTWNAESIITVLSRTSTISVPGCTLGYGVPRVDSVFKLYPPKKDAGIPRDEITLVFPNPFIPARHRKAYFELGLARSTPQAMISIFSASGVLVDTVPLRAELLTRPGRYGADGDIATLEQLGAWWDGNTAAGKPAASGLYVVALQTTNDRAAAKLALVR